MNSLNKLKNFTKLLKNHANQIVSDVSAEIGLESDSFNSANFSIDKNEYTITTDTISLLNDIEIHLEITGEIYISRGFVFSDANVYVYLNSDLYMEYTNGVEIEEDGDDISIVICNLSNSPKFY